MSTATASVATARVAAAAAPTTDQVWHQLAQTSFAVLSQVTPAGEPRSSGVVYAVIDRRLFVVTAAGSWKARHISANRRVAVTVPIRRGGLMALMVPIPPATVSFHGSAVVHPADSPKSRAVLAVLARKLPPERRSACAVIEIQPEGEFVTYGIGVSLLGMRNPAIARARVPVGPSAVPE